MKRGLSIGSLFFCFFGYFWLTAGVDLLAPPNARAWSLSSLVLCLITAGIALRYALQKPIVSTPPEIKKLINRVFALVNISQWAAIFLAIGGLKLIHHEELSLPVISVIIALHFFPLAQLFRRPSYYIIGAVILAVDTASFAFHVPLQTGIACIGTGTILLSGAAWNLLSIRSLPQPEFSH